MTDSERRLRVPAIEIREPVEPVGRSRRDRTPAQDRVAVLGRVVIAEVCVIVALAAGVSLIGWNRYLFVVVFAGASATAVMWGLRRVKGTTMLNVVIVVLAVSVLSTQGRAGGGTIGQSLALFAGGFIALAVWGTRLAQTVLRTDKVRPGAHPYRPFLVAPLVLLVTYGLAASESIPTWRFRASQAALNDLADRAVAASRAGTLDEHHWMPADQFPTTAGFYGVDRVVVSTDGTDTISIMVTGDCGPRLRCWLVRGHNPTPDVTNFGDGWSGQTN